MLIDIKFFSFLIIGVVVYWMLKKQVQRNVWISLLSLAFLFLYDRYAPLLVITMSIFSFGIAGQIQKNKRAGLWHKTGIISILLVLFVFKYLGFLNEIIGSLFSFYLQLPYFHFDKLILPLGISYITFKHISFLTDIYWGMNKRGGFFEFLSYSSLFTIFVAGPIERYERFQPQVNKVIGFNPSFIGDGFQRIVYGIFKKAVVADWIGYLISPVWKDINSYESWAVVLALLGFSIQIYMDFAGYSDIAIGSSKLFGITIMENFEKPYLQPNISQFWRSWHISLSDWIRDYLFFPLSKLSTSKVWLTLFVPVIAMGLCGLWHGSAMHFILWGMWHGFGISMFQLWGQYKRKNKKIAKLSRTDWFNYVSIAVTFLFVTIGWWWFR